MMSTYRARNALSWLTSETYELRPTAIVYYGSDLYGVMDYPRSLSIPVWVYPGCGRGALDGGKCGQR